MEDGSPLLQLPREIRDLIYAELIKEDQIVENSRYVYLGLLRSPFSLKLPYPDPRFLLINRQIHKEYSQAWKAALRDSTIFMKIHVDGSFPRDLEKLLARWKPLLRLAGGARIQFSWFSHDRQGVIDYSILDYTLNILTGPLESLQTLQLDLVMLNSPGRTARLSGPLRAFLFYHPRHIDPVETEAQLVESYRVDEAFLLDKSHRINHKADGWKPLRKLSKRLLSYWSLSGDDPSINFQCRRDNPQVFYDRTEIWTDGQAHVRTYQHKNFEVRNPGHACRHS